MESDAPPTRRQRRKEKARLKRRRLIRRGAALLVCSLVFAGVASSCPNREQAATETQARPEPRSVEVTPASYRESTRHRIVRIARSYKGTPYGPSWNCSIFTSNVYGNAVGVWMPADTVSQSYYGRPVRGKLRRGDLLLFAEHGRGISHVGVYSGRGTLIHASSYFQSTVKSEMRWIAGYAGARRIR